MHCQGKFNSVFFILKSFIEFEALVEKGVGLGTALTFMMAVTALSLPSMIMLKRVVKLPLLGVFVGIVTAGIILIGYIFNATAHLFV